MAAIAESSEANANSPSPSLLAESVKHEDKSNSLEEIVPWIDNAVQQAQLAKKTAENTFENAIQATKSRLDRILTTSSSHFNQTLVSSIIIFTNFFYNCGFRAILRTTPLPEIVIR